MISMRVALSPLLAVSFAALSLGGCNPYDPTYADLKCGPEGQCPGDLACVAGVCRAGVEQECGDGMIVGAEICDDGNLADGDGCNATCTTATCYVPATHATLDEGLADAACATVYVHSGTYAGRFLVSRDVTVLGVGATPPVLDGEQAGSVVSIGSGVLATLRNLTIKNGKALAGGGIVNRGSLDLEQVLVTENIAEDSNPNGGGIENLAGTLKLSASTVSKNRLIATAPTGAILTGVGIHSTGGILTLTDESYVEDNDIAIAGISGAAGRGGGIGTINTMITIAKSSAVRRNDLTVDGRPGNASVLGGGIYMSGGGLTMSGESVLVKNIAAAEGVNSGGNLGAVAAGGGLFATNVTISLDTVLFDGNQVSARGETGTSALGGAAALRGAVTTVTGSIFQNSIATVLGLGANSLTGTAGGGGIDLDSTRATFTGTLFFANTASAGTESATSGGAASGGGLRVSGVGAIPQTIGLVRCTFENNSATSTDSAAFGGGIYAFYNGGTTTESLTVNATGTTLSGNKVQSPVSAQGGGIRAFIPDGTGVIAMNLVNSTISGNKVDALTGTGSGGGLLALAGGGSAKINVNLASVTVAGNGVTATTSGGGGISMSNAVAPAAVTTSIKNSILATNTEGANASDCSSTTNVVSGGYNLLGVATGCTFSVTTGHLIGAAGLGPLADNGKPTKTHSLNAGSPAINAGNPAGCTDLAATPAVLVTDQRGLTRAVGGRCDIGAYEVQ